MPAARTLGRHAHAVGASTPPRNSVSRCHPTVRHPITRHPIARHRITRHPTQDLNDVIAPSCYSCFDYPNALADLVVSHHRGGGACTGEARGAARQRRGAGAQGWLTHRGAHCQAECACSHPKRAVRPRCVIFFFGGGGNHAQIAAAAHASACSKPARRSLAQRSQARLTHRPHQVGYMGVPYQNVNMTSHLQYLTVRNEVRPPGRTCPRCCSGLA